MAAPLAGHFEWGEDTLVRVCVSGVWVTPVREADALEMDDGWAQIKLGEKRYLFAREEDITALEFDYGDPPSRPAGGEEGR